MTTSLPIIAFAASFAIGKGEEKGKFRSNGLDRVWFRNVEGCVMMRSKPKFLVAALKIVEKGNINTHDDDDDEDIDDDVVDVDDDDDFDPNCDHPLKKYLSNLKAMESKLGLPMKALFSNLPSFQKPLACLREDIDEVEQAVAKTGLDFGDQLSLLRIKHNEAHKLSYAQFTPIQRMTIARNPNRPTILDHIIRITEKWVRIHGDDEAGYDDPAIVTALGTIESETYMFIGHQRHTNDSFKGYRKTSQMMKYAEHLGFPIVIFINTTGSFADLKSEELGQDEAISQNLRTMFGLKVPIITVVIGEGGSASALLIACANKLLMMENSAFYVGSPGGCAEIMQRLSSAAREEAEKENIVSQEQHYRLRIAGQVIRDADDHAQTRKGSYEIRVAIVKAMEELRIVDTEELMRHRILKFRAVGEVGYYHKEDGQMEVEKIRRLMKPSQVNAVKTREIDSHLEELKMKILAAEGTFDPTII